MRILVIGGTVFVGRHFVEAAVGSGHELTLFNRGQHNPELFPEVKRIAGDRTVDLSRIDGEWDIVLDSCGYFPRDVAASASHLAFRCQKYIFISSLSVYAEGHTTPGIGEDGALLSADPDATEVTGANYGGLKALCERAAESAMAGRVVNVRAGLIVGPYDQTDRFTYWAHRLMRGGNILAPGPPEDLSQFIDVRDLAEWLVHVAESDTVGTFNAVGPDHEQSMRQVLESGLAAGGELVWVDGTWLKEQDVTPWTQIPLWVPDAPGFSRFDNSKAISAGLTFRPIEITMRETQEWVGNRDPEHEWRAGLSSDRERELLDAWRSRTAGA